jgi:hypothetical protein
LVGRSRSTAFHRRDIRAGVERPLFVIAILVPAIVPRLEMSGALGITTNAYWSPADMLKKSPPVISSVSISPQSGPGGTTFTAAPAASGFPPLRYSYQWKIDGEAVPGATGASYTAYAAGSLTVSVRASNHQGEDSRDSAAVQVTPAAAPPQITEATILPATGAVGDVFTIITEVTGVPLPRISYQWLMDGVDIPGAMALSHAPTVSGALSVRVSATNSEGSDSLETFAVPVGAALAAPEITQAAIAPASGQVGDVFTASATATGNPSPVLNYQWMLDGVALAGETAESHAAGTEGLYTVLVTASNAAGTVSVTAPPVSVAPARSAPVISAAGISPASGRVGDLFSASATVAGSPPPLLSYQWTLDGVMIAGATAQTCTAGAEGALAVVITAANTQGSASATAPAVLVEAALSAPVIAQAIISPDSGNVGDIFTVTAEVTGNPPPALSYQWTLDGMAIGGATGATYNAGAEGTLAALVTATNAQGSDSEAAPGVPVAPALTGPTFWAASISPSTGHVGDEFTASATVTGNPPPSLTYQWMLNGEAIDGATAPSYTAGAEGTLAVMIAASNSEGRDTATSPAVLVKAALAAPAISGVSISPAIGNVGSIFTASASVAGNPTPTASYQWMLDGVAIDGAAAKSFTALAEGALTVVVTATNPVGSISATSPAVRIAPPLSAPGIAEVHISPLSGGVGDVFAANVTVTGNPAPVLSYQWTLDGVAVPGATEASCIAPMDGSLAVTVTATNAAGSAAARSAAVTVSDDAVLEFAVLDVADNVVLEDLTAEIILVTTLP